MDPARQEEQHLAGVVITAPSREECRRLREKVKWDELGLTLIGEAPGFRAGLAMIRGRRPDIVLAQSSSDKEGFERLVRESLKQISVPSFIIVSGGNDYEAARRLCTLPAAVHIVENDDAAAINESLKSAALGSRTPDPGQLEIRRLRTQLRRQRDFILLEALRDVHRGNFSWTGENPYSIRGIPFEKPLYTVVLLKFDISYEARKEGDGLIENVRDLFETDVDPDAEVCCTRDGNRLVAIIGHDTDNLPKLREKTIIAGEYADAAKHCRCTFAFSSQGHGAEDVPRLVREALTASELRRQRYTRLIRYDASTPLLDDCLVSKAKARSLIDEALVQGSFERLERFLEEQDISLRDKGASHCYPWIVLTVLREFRKLLSASERSLLEERISRLIWNIDNEIKHYRIRSVWEKEFREIFDIYLECRLKDENYHIMKARGYIEHHYAEDISLRKVSDTVHLNPAYFSHLFKTVTGMNFVDYVQQVRVEHGKERLINSGLKIEEIACMVGYRDKRHFSRMFKRIAGVNPGTYRKLYGGQYQ